METVQEPKTKTRYSVEGHKILTPISDEEFAEGMDNGKSLRLDHKAFCVLLFYSAVRDTEALRARREQFQITKANIFFSVGPRLKKIKKFRVCSGCTERNGKRSMFCRHCGKDTSTVEPSFNIKEGITTKPLKLPLKAPYMNLLKETIEQTPEGLRVFDFCRSTSYNIVRRVFKYPHLFRLTRITLFLLDGYTPLQIRSWTGLSLAALEYYAGLVSTDRMGDSLAKKHAET
jgi:integrase